MLRADKNLHFENLLGTNRPSFSSVQIFDTWITGHKDSEDLVRLFAYGSPLTEHSTILTAFTVLNYKGDTINPGIAVGVDLNHGAASSSPASTWSWATNGGPRPRPTSSGPPARARPSSIPTPACSCSATSPTTASSPSV
jgi:hypothetical protein